MVTTIKKAKLMSDPMLAIHSRTGSFSDRWIEQCVRHRIAHRVVDCHRSDVFMQLHSCDGLLWHWTHQSPTDLLMAGHVLMAAEARGLRVFPNSVTCWYFDDKLAQKYLLEAVGAPLAPAHVFYTVEEALAWAQQAQFPKVFKLRRGAGSTNVRMVRSRQEAVRLIRRAFGRGFRAAPGLLQTDNAGVRQVRRHPSWRNLLKLPRQCIHYCRRVSLMGSERGYVYFQDFVPGNRFDTRVTVVRGRAFAFTRDVRPGDFRASGSGLTNYSRERISSQCVAVAMETARRLGGQSHAFDLVTDEQGHVRVLEVSFGYVAPCVHACPGYWDNQLQWHEGHFWPQDLILSDLLEDLDYRESVVAELRRSETVLA